MNQQQQMESDQPTTRRRLGFRSRLLLGTAAIAVLALVLLGIVVTILERNRTTLNLQPDGSRHLGILIADRDGPRGKVSWHQLRADTLPPRLVVLVHGLDEPGSIWDDLTPALLDAGHAVARFEYPNDQAISLSAELFALHTRRLRDQGTQHIDIVCHSMGGLVARDMLTRDSFYPGDTNAYPKVDHLITVGTPNHGSPLAPLQPISELREVLVRWAVSFGNAKMPTTTQGLAQAAIDLTPASDFLNDLNARALPTDLSITILAGRVLPIDVIDAKAVVEDSVLRNLLPPQERDALFSQLNALVKGVGDGVVPIESAMLAGVDDVVILEANHRAMLKKSALAHTAHNAADIPLEDAPAIAVILQRLDHPHKNTANE